MIFLNILISASLISFCAWLAQKRPDLAGFLISLPLSTLLVLALNNFQYKDSTQGFLLAKSILIAVPSTLVFFIPFLLAEKWKLSFWTSYFWGMGLLVVGFFIHQTVYGFLTGSR